MWLDTKILSKYKNDFAFLKSDKNFLNLCETKLIFQFYEKIKKWGFACKDSRRVRTSTPKLTFKKASNMKVYEPQRKVQS